MFDVFTRRGFVVIGELQLVLTPEHAAMLARQLRVNAGHLLRQRVPTTANDLLRVPVGASEYLTHLSNNHTKG